MGGRKRKRALVAVENKTFNLHDLVWAEMKGSPPWPGQVVNPPLNSTIRKNSYYIFFFGSYNYSWIKSNKIFPYYKFVHKYSKGLRYDTYRNALRDIAKLHNEMVRLNNSGHEKEVIVEEKQEVKHKRQEGEKKRKRKDDKKKEEQKEKPEMKDEKKQEEKVEVKQEIIELDLEPVKDEIVIPKPATKRTKEEQDARQRLINKRLRIKWATKQKKHSSRKENIRSHKSRVSIAGIPSGDPWKYITKELVIRLNRCDE